MFGVTDLLCERDFGVGFSGDACLGDLAALGVLGVLATGVFSAGLGVGVALGVAFGVAFGVAGLGVLGVLGCGVF